MSLILDPQTGMGTNGTQWVEWHRHQAELARHHQQAKLHGLTAFLVGVAVGILLVVLAA